MTTQLLTDDEILAAITDAPLGDTVRGHLLAIGRSIEAKTLERRWPPGLLDRIKAAEKRIENNYAPRRIPADPQGGDVDLVLAEVRYLIEGKWPPFWIKDVPQ